MTASNDDAQSPVLKVQELSFSYPQRHVFSGWSHIFSAGLTWVKGSNGCGKSTLLKLLAGALKPIAGDIDVHGINLVLRQRQGRKVFHSGRGRAQARN